MSKEVSWDKIKPGWYNAKVNNRQYDDYSEIINWIENNIQGYDKHTVWRMYLDLTKQNPNCYIFEIRFRHERDYEWFVLRWV